MTRKVILWVGVPLLVILLAGGILVAAALRSSQLPTRPGGGPTSAHSPLIGLLIPRTDREFGYSMLVPARWQAVDLGDRRTYVPPDSQHKPDRLVLTATNYKVLADRNKNLRVMQLELFRRHPDPVGWAEAIEMSWRDTGMRFQKESSLANGVIYSVRPAEDQMQLMAFVVDAGQPMNLTMEGYGVYSSRETLVREGLLEDFQTMAQSLHAADTK